MGPTTPNPLPFLSERETRLLALAFLCSDSPKVNYTKLALAAGYKTSNSAYVCLGNVRKKAFGRGVVEGGAAVAAGGEGETGELAKAGGKRGVERVREGDGEVVGVTKKCKVAGGEGEGEDAVVGKEEGGFEG